MIGHSINDAELAVDALKGMTLEQLLASAGSANARAAGGAHELLMRAADSVPLKRGGATLSRFAASPKALSVLKVATPLAAAGGVLGAGDVLFGGDSAANKVMDGTAMTIGGILGSVGGPMGAAAGAGIGKGASDSLQWLFGDKKSAEQRRMEEALMALKGGVI